MFNILFNAIGIGALISGIVLLINGNYQKDYGKYGRAIARFYTAGSLLIIERQMEYVLFGVFLIVFTDLLSSAFWWASKKYRLQIEYNSLAKTVRNLLGKLGSILENPYIGFFTANLDGEIEFANERLLTILDIDHPANIFDYLEPTIVERVKDGKDIFCMTVLKTKNRLVPIKLSIVKTENGHTTLTGSILEDITMPFIR